MRLLLLDDLITSYTHTRPGAGLVVDLDLGTASGLLASRCRTSPNVACLVCQLDGLSAHAVSRRGMAKTLTARIHPIHSGATNRRGRKAALWLYLKCLRKRAKQGKR